MKIGFLEYFTSCFEIIMLFRMSLNDLYTVEPTETTYSETVSHQLIEFNNNAVNYAYFGHFV